MDSFVYYLNAALNHEGSLSKDTSRMDGQDKMKFRLRLIARTSSAACLCLLALTIPGPVRAEDKAPLRIPKMSQAPIIDGVLDSPLWEREALKIENFVQLSPKENGIPSEKTVAYIGYDDKNLYYAFRCFDSHPKKIRCSITNRDNIIDDDWIFIFLDSFNEKRRAFSFILNPAGIQMDAIRTEEGGLLFRWNDR
jgi:hypothetical protein